MDIPINNTSSTTNEPLTNNSNSNNTTSTVTTNTNTNNTSTGEAIQVCLRIRPLTEKEIEFNPEPTINIINDNKITMKAPEVSIYILM